jgi:CRP/FNR family transcriptional regulator
MSSARIDVTVQPDTAHIARALELFPTLRDAPPECLDLLARETQLLQVPAGTRLFDEQARCTAFPLVLDGAIRVSKISAHGREIMLYRVAPGESCVLTSGCLLGHIDYAATGIAESAVTLIAVPLPLFELLLARHEPFRRHVFELFGARLADLMLLVEEVAFHRLDQRLAALLLARGPVLRTTHQALADELGSVREMVSRLLGSFAGRGLVQLAREQIDVIDEDGLRRLAGDKIIN